MGGEEGRKRKGKKYEYLRMGGFQGNNKQTKQKNHRTIKRKGKGEYSYV
jgi:hypothetical protein